MAVYTHISNEELAEFLTNYSLGEMRSLHGIAEGVENSNYLLRTTTGEYILTLYEKRVNPDDLPFFLGLTQHLAAKGIPCPQPVANHSGKMLGKIRGKSTAIVTFLEGRSCRTMRNWHLDALGTTLAKMHLAAEDFSSSRENSVGQSVWQSMAAEFADRADSIQHGLAGYIEKELQWLEERWPEDLPRGIIHADLFPDNVFFLNGKLSGVIDFYFACRDFLMFDLAICMNAWCFEPGREFNITKASLFLKAYDAVRPLANKEKGALPLLARGAAMRFLLTRCTDLLNPREGALVVPHDPLEYLDKLRFHQQVETVSAYGI